MMYIGTSFGKCIKSILQGEVSEEEVLVIICGTKAKGLAKLYEVIKEYHSHSGNEPGDPVYLYDISSYEIDDVLNLVQRLYLAGKIHQPRMFNSLGHLRSNYLFSETWLEVVPSYTGNNHAVVDSYNKYRMLKAMLDD